jgi:Patatin-like phospholipase
MSSEQSDNVLNNATDYLIGAVQNISSYFYGDEERGDGSDVITLEHNDDEPDDELEVCKNYIPRRDRPRRGKREKKGRVTKIGTYHNYDQSVLDYFRTYKSITRGVRSTINTTISIGYMGMAGIYDGATVLTDVLLRKSYPPFKSDQITDMSRSSISFSGGGYNCSYHLGSMKYIFEHPQLFEKVTFLGASGGAGVAAIALAYQDDPNCMRILRRILNTLIEMADEGHTLSEQVDRYTTILLSFIDSDRFDLHIKDSTRLQISVTDITNVIPMNQIVTKFKDLAHLEATIRASACIPILLDDQIRKIENRIYLDGGLTNNLPALDQNTIRISCLNYPTLQAEIHPEQYLSIQTCFVHPGERIVLKMMEEGYVDFIKFINPYIEKKQMEELDAEILKLESDFTRS